MNSTLENFASCYPDCQFRIEKGSFTEIREMMFHDEVDILFTSFFEEEDFDRGIYCTERMIRCSQMAYMLKTNPLSKREKLYFSDLRNQNSISLSPSKSPNYMKNAITRYSAEAGFIPKIAYFVQSSESISENEFGEHDIFIADRYFNVLDTEQFTAKKIEDTEGGVSLVCRRTGSSYIQEFVREAAAYKGGHPDRFVKQYEYMDLILDPILDHCGGFCNPGEKKVNDWGVTVYWQEGTPGPFPVCEGDAKLIKDITLWKEVLKTPDPRQYSAEEWKAAEDLANATDRKEKFVAPFVVTGIFEKLHYFMGIEDTMINFYEEPEAMHDLIDHLTDWEIECAKVEIEHLHPNALFHHDDWGSQVSTFISPAMFEEFILPAYEKIYGFWKKNGIEVIIHHSDSYAATLVPYMIQMGVDVWQGAVYENNIPEVLKNYGGKISIQGGLDNGKYDKADWSREAIHKGLGDLFETAGTRYLIPSLTMGGPGSTFDGVYDTVDKEIDEYSKKYFK